MVTGKTKSGFKFQADPEVIKDAEFLEKFVSIRKGDGLVIFEVLEDILGSQGKKALYDHCRDENGRVPLDAVSEEFNDICTILSADDQTKN